MINNSDSAQPSPTQTGSTHADEAMGGGVARRWWLAGLTGLLGILGGAGYAAVAPQSYLARAYVLVVTQEPGEDLAAVRFAQAYGRIAANTDVIVAIASGQAVAVPPQAPTPAASPPTTAQASAGATPPAGQSHAPEPSAATSPAAASPAAGPTDTVATPGVRARVPASASELRRQVSATTSPDAPVIEITGSAEDPRRAADLANLVADSLIAYASGSAAQARLRMMVLSPAYPPADPSSPRPTLAVTIGGAAGLLAGAFAVMAGFGRWPPDARWVRRHARTGRIEASWHGDGRPPVDQPSHVTKHDSKRTVRR
jgi:hypothetical protein